MFAKKTGNPQVELGAAADVAGQRLGDRALAALSALARSASSGDDRFCGDRLAELVKALKSPEVDAELNKVGLLPAPGTRQELADFIAAESRTWGQVIRDRKITAN